MTIKAWVVTIAISLTTGLVWSQQNTLSKVRQYYKNFSQDSCLKLYPSGGVNRVVLIRHGQPNIDKKGWRNRKEAMKYVSDYDSVGIIPPDFTPVCLKAGQSVTVYHSTLPRAAHTAKLLFEDTPMVADPRFREFERKVMKFINVKLPLGFWVGTSRILWFAGVNKRNIESFKTAKRRAKGNAVFLASKATENGEVILVAHGLHNKFVMKYLRKTGWVKVRKGGSGYLAINILAKPK